MCRSVKFSNFHPPVLQRQRQKPDQLEAFKIIFPTFSDEIIFMLQIIHVNQVKIASNQFGSVTPLGAGYPWVLFLL